MTANGFVKIFTTPEGKKLALGSGDEWLTYQELRRSGARAEQIRAGVEQYTVRGPHPYSFEGMTCHAFPDGVLDGAMFELTEQDPGGPVNGNVDMDTKAARWMEKGIGDKWPNRICASLDAGYPCLVITYDSSQRVVRAVLYRPHVFPCTLPDVQADVRFFLENVGRGKLYQGRDLQAAGLSILVSPALQPCDLPVMC